MAKNRARLRVQLESPLDDVAERLVSHDAVRDVGQELVDEPVPRDTTAATIGETSGHVSRVQPEHK